MKEELKKLLKRASETNGDGQISQLVGELSSALKQDPVNIHLLEARAVLFTKLQSFGQAINDYRMILRADPENRSAKVMIEQLSTILRFRNTDIFENPNTTFDPWLE
jgi:hypothetical protein